MTSDGRLRSAPPGQTSDIVFIDIGLDSTAPACVEPPRNEPFEFDVPKGTPGAPNGLKVKIAGDQPGEDSLRDCIFNGFYTTTPGAPRLDGVPETILRPLDKLEIITSGRYCSANASMVAHLSHHAPVAPPATLRESPQAVLPTCRRTGEDRVEIPVWEARRTSGGQMRSSPPERYGELVFMVAVSPGDCRGNDATRTLDFFDPGDPPVTGTFLALLGDPRSQNGHCVWSGLFMFESGAYKMGSSFLTFVAVDEPKVASTGRFCLAARHGALHRPAARR